VLLGDDIIVGDPPQSAAGGPGHETGAPVIAVMEVPRTRSGTTAASPATSFSRSVASPRSGGKAGAGEGAFEPSDHRPLRPHHAVLQTLAATPPDRAGEIQLTEVCGDLSPPADLRLHVPGRRFDAGNKADFLRATVEIALEHPELGSVFGECSRSFSGNLPGLSTAFVALLAWTPSSLREGSPLVAPGLGGVARAARAQPSNTPERANERGRAGPKVA